MDFTTFTQLPSRFSAEPILQKERANLLAEVTSKGSIADYHGVRISGTGRRFEIKDAIILDLFDTNGKHYGQAAMFHHWQPID